MILNLKFEPLEKEKRESERKREIKNELQ